jgi:hypothetical protein
MYSGKAITISQNGITYTKEFLLSRLAHPTSFETPKWECSQGSVKLIRKRFSDFKALKIKLLSPKPEAGRLACPSSFESPNWRCSEKAVIPASPRLSNFNVSKRRILAPNVSTSPACALPARRRDEGEIAEIKKQAKLLLNQITPDTFEKLSEKFFCLKVSLCLLDIARLIVQKAVEDPTYVDLYTKLCTRISSIRTESFNGDALTEMLENLCTEEFYRTTNTAMELREAEAGGSVKAENIMLLKEKLGKETRQKKGVVVLTSHLYNAGLIGWETILTRLGELLNKREEQDIHNFCAMAYVCGRNLSRDFRVCQRLTDLIRQLDQLSANAKLGKLIQFKVEDLVKFSRGGYIGESSYNPVTRMTTATLREIRENVTRERENKEFVSSRAANVWRGSRSSRGTPSIDNKSKNGTGWRSYPENLPALKDDRGPGQTNDCSVGHFSRQIESRPELDPPAPVWDDSKIHEAVARLFGEALRSGTGLQHAVGELCQIPNAGGVVYHLINISFDKDEAARKLAGQMLELMNTGMRISAEQLRAGVARFTDDAADIIIDVPLYWRYVLEVMGDVLSHCKPPPQFFCKLRWKVNDHVAVARFLQKQLEKLG